ncbi:MAG: hypothetical protein DCF22_06575 [Leptolyngbya sp.]|nr:MAG: hypothetical protein DCF22_06575 [Leptolyngbya sp.]
MPRGGFREGSLKLRQWKSGKTTVIRVPQDLASKVLELARALDEGRPVWIGEPSSDDLYEVREIVLRYAASAKPNPRWDKASKLIAELKPHLH